MGTVDRGIRVMLALVVVVLYFTHQISGTTSIILLALSGIFVLTSFVGTCPLYSLLGISTIKEKAKSSL